MMQLFSGILFALAMILAVVLGGQSIDYTWGPALLALAAALLTALPSLPPREGWPRMTRAAGLLLLIAGGWILWRCAGSPVREFARSDALLVGAMLSSCLWALAMPPGGTAIRALMAGLALLALANLGIGLHQLSDRSFAWPFASRPSGLPSGLFGHYNHFADFSLVMAVILAARFRSARDSRLERILQLAGAAAGIGCVVLSGSRGGLLSLGAALVVLIGAWALLAWRDKSRLRGAFAVAAILVALLAAMLGPAALKKVEARRGNAKANLMATADNQSRWLLIGTAVDISAAHPWTGGGSRSFGWEKYPQWDPRDDGGVYEQNDDFVHNELVQVAVDYGWIGALLVAGAVVGVGLTGVAGLLGRERVDGAADSLACAGLAALAGTLFHSNTSFVTHTLPGAIYLGLACGFALPRQRPNAAAQARAWAWRPLPAAFAALLAFAGWHASLTYRDLWPVWYGQAAETSDPDEALDLVDRALRRWPDSEIAGRAAELARDAAEPAALPADERNRWLERTARLYDEAVRLHPYDPEWAINRANVLSSLRRDDEAERDYLRAIELQGGMEASFRSRYHLGLHLYQRWYRIWLEERREDEALHEFLRARDLLRAANSAASTEQSRAALKGVEETIAFLEGAKVVPRAPAR
jgi:tetratricopeptide (TPR) repeat protein